MKNLGGSSLFAVPKAPARTAVAEEQAAAFVEAERPAAIVASPADVDRSRVGRTTRLSVDVPAATLRALKIRAIEQGQTVREFILKLLEREGLPTHEPVTGASPTRV
ncbi:MAG: hypothetical protein JOZ69_17820 [Myxococcales bacterium]|nr:hypothetical protein [Myxococcales bacterium]